MIASENLASIYKQRCEKALDLCRIYKARFCHLQPVVSITPSPRPNFCNCPRGMVTIRGQG